MSFIFSIQKIEEPIKKIDIITNRMNGDKIRQNTKYLLTRKVKEPI